jgi:hypothetical protein
MRVATCSNPLGMELTYILYTPASNKIIIHPSDAMAQLKQGKSDNFDPNPKKIICRRKK